MIRLPLMMAWVALVLFGIFTIAGLGLTGAEGRARATLYAQLDAEGVSVVADEATLSPSRGGNRLSRGIRYSFTLGADLVIEGAGPIPRSRVEGLFADGPLQVLYVPGDPARNAPAVTVEAWRAAGFRHPDQHPWARPALWAAAIVMILAGLVLGRAALRPGTA